MPRIGLGLATLVIAVTMGAMPLGKAMADISQRDDVRAFIGEMAVKHEFDTHRLNALFAAIEIRDDIIARISRPAEKTKPWYEYRAIFLDRQRIERGAAFWRLHRDALSAAQREYGVPEEIIVAIIGVETRYGKVTGRDGVLEALSTLAFGYPRRAKFFRSELEHYLLLTREERIEPLDLRGSYAGAMGIAQFMPSSYRAYAVDFDADGRRDLWQNPIDAIGSVGNYLARHQWRASAPIASLAMIKGNRYESMISDSLKPSETIGRMRAAGVEPIARLNADEPAILLEMKVKNGYQYWLGLHNFYVITRYNRSPMYALAVLQLSDAIRQQYAGGRG